MEEVIKTLIDILKRYQAERRWGSVSVTIQNGEVKTIEEKKTTVVNR